MKPLQTYLGAPPAAAGLVLVVQGPDRKYAMGSVEVTVENNVDSTGIVKGLKLSRVTDSPKPLATINTTLVLRGAK